MVSAVVTPLNVIKLSENRTPTTENVQNVIDYSVGHKEKQPHSIVGYKGKQPYSIVGHNSSAVRVSDADSILNVSDANLNQPTSSKVRLALRVSPLVDSNV